MDLLLARAATVRKVTPAILAFSVLAAFPAFAQETETSTPEIAASAPEATLVNSTLQGTPVQESPEKEIDIPVVLESSHEQIAADMTRWLRLLNDKTRGSFAEYARMAKAYPDWPQRARFTRQAERSLTGRENDSDVIGFFADNPPRTLRALEIYVRALRSDEQHPVAAKAIREFWRTAPLRVSEQNELFKRFGKSLDNADLHARNDRIIMGALDHPDDIAIRDPKKRIATLMASRRALIGAIALGDGNRTANTVRMSMTETIRRSNRGEIGSAQISRIDAQAAALPAKARAETGFIYDYARWLEFTDRPQEAARLLMQHPAHEHGDTAYAFKVRDTITRELLERGHTQEAYRVASEHGLLQTDASYRDAEWLSGWVALRFTGHAQNARTHFKNQLGQATSLFARSNGLYWLGRAELALGNKDAAHTYLEQAAKEAGTMFYGQLAATDAFGEVNIGLPKPDTPAASVRDSFNRRSLVKAARTAISAGQTGLTRDFIAALANNLKSQDEATLTLDLAKQSGLIDMEVFVAKRAGVQGFMTGSDGYPTVRTVQGCPETAFTFGLIRQETGFKDDAESHAGALGRMQLMPATAAAEARKLGIAHNVRMLTSNPSHNMRLGCSYLQTQVENFGGSYILATAAYNAGPGRPRQWQNRFGSPTSPSLPLARQQGEPAYWATLDWIESVPFEETRNYIKFVLSNTNIYRAVLSTGNGAKLKIRQDLTR